MKRLTGSSLFIVNILISNAYLEMKIQYRVSDASLNEYEAHSPKTVLQTNIVSIIAYKNPIRP